MSKNGKKCHFSKYYFNFYHNQAIKLNKMPLNSFYKKNFMSPCPLYGCKPVKIPIFPLQKDITVALLGNPLRCKNSSCWLLKHCSFTEPSQICQILPLTPPFRPRKFTYTNWQTSDRGQNLASQHLQAPNFVYTINRMSTDSNSMNLEEFHAAKVEQSHFIS